MVDQPRCLEMLSTVDETLSGGQYMGSVFNSACKWMKQNVKTWSLWIQITPPAPGRVLITLSASTRTMVTAVVVVSIVIVFILQVFLFVKRYDPVVSSADHQLCQLMLTGTYFGFAGVLTLISDQTYSCLLTPWLLAMSFALVFGIMIVRTVVIQGALEPTGPCKPGPHSRAQPKVRIP